MQELDLGSHRMMRRGRTSCGNRMLLARSRFDMRETAVRRGPPFGGPAPQTAVTSPSTARDRMVFVQACAASRPFTSKWEEKNDSCCSCSWKW